ncbi:MAG: hypothetical protein ABUL60_29165 [Myxococcales bacterium]
MRVSYCLGLSWSVLAAAALLAACGGSQPAATTPAEPGAAPAGEAPAGGGELTWSDDMSVKDKAAFMKAKVMPAMSKVFKDHDAAKYEKFSCKTCHGADMKPKPQMALPELHFKDGKMAEAEKMPEMVKWMHESVVPAMADVFGKKPYDPATNSGFGCMGCHKVNM